MSRYLVIADGVVANVIEAGESLKDTWILDTWGAGRDWIYDSDSNTCVAPESNNTFNAAKIEYFWAKSELETADVLESKARCGDLGDIPEEYVLAYKRALRAYATYSTKDGLDIYSINDLAESYAIDGIDYVVSVGTDGRPVSPIDSGVSEA